MPGASTTDKIENQRAADAAFFEDWSEWASLDDLPEPDKRYGYFIEWPAMHNRYWCRLRQYSAASGGPCFEISLPPISTVERLISQIPGVVRLQGRRYAQPGNHIIPVEHWRQLRSLLPDIKAAVCAWVNR